MENRGTPIKSNASKQKKWKANPGLEARKLGFAADDWNLAGGGSRASRQSRSSRSPKPPPSPADVCSPVSSPAKEVVVLDSASAISELTDTPSTISSRAAKPASTRVIIEVDPVTKMLEQHLKCPKCCGEMAVSFPTACIATTVRLDCKNKAHCTYSVLEKPAVATNVILTDQPDNRNRNTDMAINALYVLSFVASGDGGTEAARLLGLLGLPNSTTMQARSFGNIERQMSANIQSFGDDIIRSNLAKAVAIKLGDKVDSEGNKLYDLWLERKLPKEHWPVIDGCADMGWNQKGSGCKRNSKSGHAFIYEMETRSIVAKSLCSKGCGFCKSWYTRHTQDEDPPEHNCFINHVGSSGAMEPIAILNMYKELYEQQVIVGWFVVDDDSSIKAKLRWNNADHEANTGEKPTIINSKGNLVTRPNHGGIPGHMPQPTFVADPNHRRKTLASELYSLAAKAKTDPAMDKILGRKRKRKTQEWCLGMSKMDCRRLSKNFAFMARCLQYCDTEQEMLDSGKAVVEHHFDNHEWCGKWCQRKHKLDDDTKFYRSKDKELKLYEKLQSIFARFLIIEALRELNHNMDTCANESFNNTISWIAPKNKVYCGTESLKSRIAIAVGITTLGMLEYYTKLFERLGIQMHDDVLHFLQVKSKGRYKRIAKTKTSDFKKKRKAAEHAKIKEEAVEARQRRDGALHKPGVGMGDGYDDDDEKKPAAKKPKASKLNKKGEMPVCSKCKQPGHWRPTNKLCKYYVPRGRKKGTSSADKGSASLPGTETAPSDVTLKDSSMGATETEGATSNDLDTTADPQNEENQVQQMAEELARIDAIPLDSDCDSSEDDISVASSFSDNS